MLKSKLSLLILIISILLGSTTTSAQLVAFSGKNSDPNDNFAFVALDNIPMGTVIYFTNREWNNTTGRFLEDGEGTIKLTLTTDLTMGQVVEITELQPNMFELNSNVGAVVYVATEPAFDGWSPTSADPHYAFAAPDVIYPTDNVTEVYAMMDTRIGVHANTFADPRIGTNSSPNAIVCDWTISQTVSIDYNLDRTMASIEYLDDCDINTYLTDRFTPIRLENFVFDIIFKDGFE